MGVWTNSVFPGVKQNQVLNPGDDYWKNMITGYNYDRAVVVCHNPHDIGLIEEIQIGDSFFWIPTEDSDKDFVHPAESGTPDPPWRHSLPRAVANLIREVHKGFYALSGIAELTVQGDVTTVPNIGAAWLWVRDHDKALMLTTSDGESNPITAGMPNGPDKLKPSVADIFQAIDTYVDAKIQLATSDVTNQMEVTQGRKAVARSRDVLQGVLAMYLTSEET